MPKVVSRLEISSTVIDVVRPEIMSLLVMGVSIQRIFICRRTYLAAGPPEEWKMRMALHTMAISTESYYDTYYTHLKTINAKTLFPPNQSSVFTFLSPTLTFSSSFSFALLTKSSADSVDVSNASLASSHSVFAASPHAAVLLLPSSHPPTRRLYSR